LVGRQINMTSYEKALAEWKANPANARRKGSATHYANGKPRVEGKTQKEIKAEKKAYKPVIMHYTTETNHVIPQKKAPNWAMDVHGARERNQKFSSKHFTDKGYREDYR